MTALHIAQVNIGRMKAALQDPVMAGFVARLEEINALADRSPGFVWRLQTPEGDATYLRPYDDDRILFNMSVWESVEQLKRYVYYTASRSRPPFPPTSRSSRAPTGHRSGPARLPRRIEAEAATFAPRDAA
jgi:hypothetical protein